MKIRTIALTMMVVLLAVFGLSNSGHRVVSAQGEGTAWVRLLHASPNVPTVKFIVNGNTIGQSLAFGATFDNGEFFSVQSGNAAVDVVTAGDKAIFPGGQPQSFKLDEGSATTFVLFGYQGDSGVRSLRLIALRHDADMLPLGDFSSVRFLNALVYDTNKSDPEKERFPIDVWNADLVGERNPLSKIYGGLRYGEITSPLPVKAALQSYTVTLPGEKTNFISQPIRLQMEKQRAYTVILIGYTNRDFLPKRAVQLVAASFKLNPDGSLFIPRATPIPITGADNGGGGGTGGDGGGNNGGGGAQPTNPPPPPPPPPQPTATPKHGGPKR